MAAITSYLVNGKFWTELNKWLQSADTNSHLFNYCLNNYYNSLIFADIPRNSKLKYFLLAKFLQKLALMAEMTLRLAQ